MVHFSWRDEQLTLSILTQPKASTDAIVGVQDHQLKVRITAPPIEGKANNHLIKFLSSEFGVRKNAVNLISGETSRHKKVVITAPKKFPAQAGILQRPTQQDK